MRKLALASALVFVLLGAAIAGDYHSGTSLICAECHVMHGSQEHGYAADGSDVPVAIGGSAPYHFLLRNEINALCLTCHDGNVSYPDVLGLTGSPPPNGRQAGALNGLGAAGYFDADGHTLGSTDPAPGGLWSNADGLKCTDCHQQHGYGGFVGGGGNPYRNMLYNTGGVPKAPVTYAVGVNDSTADVYEISASAGGSHYSPDNVHFNEPDPTASAYGAYCQGCHTDFHGSSSSTNMRNQLDTAGAEWYRHPTADANIGALGGGHSSLGVYGDSLNVYRVKVMDPDGNWDGTGTGLTPSCFTCHKAHGNKNAFGLIYPTGVAPLTEEGGGTSVKQLCKQCHVQG